jgi:Txe/YoeB family toxin of toxin-antitoxin system
MYRVVYTAQAQKDAKKLNMCGLRGNVDKLLQILAVNPFQNPPPYKKLLGEMVGLYSRRINRQHRLVYEIIPADNIVRILQMWTHYE